MANAFYERGSSFNPDELADGDAIEAEFDSVGRGFDTIEDLVNANKAGYPSQTFHVAPATEPTHAIQQDQLEAALSFKLDAVNYNAADVLNKLKTVDGYDSGLDADCLDGQHGSYYRNADNINAGTLAKERLPGTIDSSTTGNAATATKVAATAPIGGDVDLVTGAMGGNDFFRIRVGGPDNAGWVEIATTDDGDEPIYVRQYGATIRTATLLDSDGNTRIPGKLVSYGNGFSFSDDMRHGLFNGGQDGADSTHANIKISSWFGIGFSPSISGTSVPQNEYSHWFNTRTGDVGCRGGIWAGNGYLHSVTVLTGDAWHGNWLPIPAGYAESQCRFFISAKNTNPYDNAWDLREDLNTQHYSEYFYLQNNREVVARTRVYNDINDSFQYHNGLVNYIVIGYK